MSNLNFFSHVIDQDTFYCIRCGRFLAKLQADHAWKGNTVHPVCPSDSNVTAISHLARNRHQ